MTAPLPTILGVACGVLFAVLLEVKAFHPPELEENTQATAWRSHSLPVRILLVIFLAFMNVYALQNVVFEAIPYFLSKSHLTPGVEYAEVQRGVRQRAGYGLRLRAVGGYERLVPFDNSRATFCIDRGWTLEMNGRVGDWGIHLERVVARRPVSNEWIEINYLKYSVTFHAKCK